MVTPASTVRPVTLDLVGKSVLRVIAVSLVGLAIPELAVGPEHLGNPATQASLGSVVTLVRQVGLVRQAIVVRQAGQA